MNTRIKLDNYVSIYGLINCITLSSFNKEILFPLKPFSGEGTALPICLILKVSSAQSLNCVTKQYIFKAPFPQNRNVSLGTAYHQKIYCIQYIYYRENSIIIASFFCYELQTVCFSSFILKHHLHNQYFLFQTLLLVLLILILLLLSIIFIASGVSDMGTFKKHPYSTF